MKLKFELKDENHVSIINKENGRVVGRIFTPSGTGEVIKDAIQICGFSRAFELWGCGVIGDNDGKALQDIQLLFKNFKSASQPSMKGLSFGTKDILEDCGRCFHKKDKFGNCKCSELKVLRRHKDIKKWEKRRKNYENKEKIIDKLK